MTEQLQTRCLFCSLMCPLSVKARGRNLFLPEYLEAKIGATRGGFHQGRLCYRGHYVVSLIAHPKRLTEAYIRQDENIRPCVPPDAVQELARALHNYSGKEIAVILDGNLPCEYLAGGIRLAKQWLGTENVAIYLPPSDDAILRGISGAERHLLPVEEVETREVILSVGDIFGTHPVIARSVLDAKTADRRNQLVVLDSTRSRTSRFADNFMLVAPGTEAISLAALARMLDVDIASLAPEWAGRSPAQLCEMAHVPEKAMRAAANALLGAKRAAVTISLPLGRTRNIALTAALATSLCREGRGFIPLFTYGNAAGAMHAARALGTISLADLLERMASGEIRAMLCIGTDLRSALPSRIVEEPMANLKFIAVASPLPNRMTELGKICIPIGFWFEEEGTAQDYLGRARPMNPLLPPPKGALTVRRFLMTLSEALDAKKKLDLSVTERPASRPIEKRHLERTVEEREAGGDFLLVSRTDSAHFADGTLTQYIDWAHLIEPTVNVLINERDAATMGIVTRHARQCEVEIRSNGHRATASAVVSNEVPPGVVAVSPSYGVTRPLFEWRGCAECGPSQVSLEKKSQPRSR